VFGDLWDWVAGVFARIGDVSVYWLLLALALKTAESALIGVTWRNILRASYPRSGLTFKTSWGASQGGTAINAVTPAQAGTAAMIGIFRTSIRGSTVAGVTSATVVQSLFFTGLSVFIVIAVAIFRPRTVERGTPSDETGGFVAEHPFLVALGAIVVVALAVVLWRRLKPRLLEFWNRAKAGGAILRDWRRYARQVALPSAASYACRIGVNVVFMAAFGIPITAFTVFLVASSHMLSGLFAITPGGVGQTQALDVATLRGHASTDDIAAFSITQDALMTIWNVVLGVIVMVWAFGFGTMKELFSSRGRKAEATAS
ncbi:MAG TPA: lysylphosphatidylglycerol synthase domain-containing protein, partial [Gaiellaceae bacterium]|nr:lysylphosphatidylglycerol synthase domain-containing protein [Gaiellaceae bacterium]